MPDCGTLDLSCNVQNAASSAFEQIAKSAGEAAGQLVGDALSWWINTGSVDPNTDTVRNLQQYTMPIIGAMLAGSILVQGIRMALSRKKDPAVNVALGLIRYAIVNAVGLALLAAALKAGDDFSKWLVDQSMGGFAQRVGAALNPTNIDNAFLLLLIAAVLCVLAVIQWVLGFVRQAGVLVLAVLLPLAASGSINESTKGWLNRILPWVISLVLYKPMAAMIYAIGFTMIGDGQDFATVMTGVMVMFLAIIAMPAMMRFFSWTQVSATGGSGAGGVVAAGATGAASMASMRAARSMQMTGPGSAPQGADRSAPSSQLSLTSGPGSSSGGGGGPSGGPSGGGSGGGPLGGGSGGSTGGGPSASGASAAPEAGVPSARAGAGASTAGGAQGAAAGGGGAASAGAAAAGPAGAAAAGGAAIARGAQQAGQAAADGFTQGGEQQQ